MTALPLELLARLEAAAAGKLSKEETQKLEEELAELPEGTAAAADFQRIWAGLAALRSEEFRSKMAIWEQEWQPTNDEELVEWYLANKLSDDNRQLVDERLEKEEVLAGILKQQSDLQAGFQALKDQTFREQVQKWGAQDQAAPVEAKVRTLRPVWRRVVGIAAAALLLVTAGVFWNIQTNYSDEALAAKYYKTPPTGNTMGAGEIITEADYLEAFSDAHRSMQTEDYAAARLLFEQLVTQIPPDSFSADDLTYYQDNLDWNLVLAMLGQGESGDPLRRRLDVILSSPSHTYHTEAKELAEDLDGFWR